VLKSPTGFLDASEDQAVPNAASSRNAIVAHNVTGCAWTLSWLLGSMKGFFLNQVCYWTNTQSKWLVIN